MLEVAGLQTYYGASQVLFGLTMAVNDGEVVSLLGRNGMGKTTTVNSIMGIVPCEAERLHFGDQSLVKLPSYRRARLGLGLVPEGRQIFPNLSVYENLVANARLPARGGAPWHLERVLDMFPVLRERQRQMGSLLSGGEQQMLAVGRALMTNPRLLILDEATEGLAPLVRREIWTCLGRLKSEGQAILVIDKNIGDITRVADRHYILEKGQIAWEGDTDRLLGDSSVRERYLGV
ncbi:MAG: ABC transporter ATP-binding protein [Pseudomonadota bacterium]